MPRPPACGVDESCAVRRALIRIVEWPWFDRAIIALILANSAAAAALPPPAAGIPTPAWIDQLTFISQLVFTVELGLRGFASSLRSYVRDPWNIFDFTVVFALWLPYLIPGMDNLVAIRCVRALRPLRTINRMRSIRTLCETMVRASRGLASVLALCAFIFTIFSILGMQLFGGTLRGRCAASAAEVADVRHADDAPMCWPEHERPGGCPPGQHCIDVGSNPLGGAIGFDSFGRALWTVFMSVTLEGWSAVMYLEMEAFGPWASVYFVALVVLGSFVVLNLFLVIIHDQFVPSDSKRSPKKQGPEPQRRRSSAVRMAVAQRVSAVAPGLPFQQVMTGLVVANTACMCLYYYGMPVALEHALEIANLVFVGAFSLEMCVMVYALGPRGYVHDPMNVLDGTIVLVSLLEIIAAYGHINIGIHMTALRSLRLFRVAKLARSYRGLRKVVQMMVLSVAELGGLLVLLTLLLFVYALLGEQIFGLRYSAAAGFTENPRANFDSLPFALISTFIALTGENWTDMYVDAYRVAPVSATAFFGTIIVVGNFVVINLVITILISNVQRVSDEERSEHSKRKSAASPMFALAEEAPAEAEAARAAEAEAAEAQARRHDAVAVVGSLLRAGREDEAAAPRSPHAPELADQPSLGGHSTASAESDESGLLGRGGEGGVRGAWRAALRLRARAHRVVESARFEQCMLALIVASAVVILLEPLDTEAAALRPAWQLRTLDALDLAVTLAFTAELLLKHFALGVHAYWASSWNRLDGAIVLLSVAALFGGDEGSGEVFKCLRLARLLRPLRLITHHSGMKLIVNALLLTLPMVLNVCIVCVLFLVIFGILGVSCFGGMFAECNDPSVRTEGACVGTFSPADGPAGELVPRAWRNPPLGSFDNLLSASLLLFELSSLEGWPTAMFRGIDAVAPGVAPERDANPAAALYFVTWTLVGALFVRNLFIGVIVDTFNSIKQEQDGLLLMTPEQQQWVLANQLMVRANAIQRAARPAWAPAQQLYDLVTSARFERAIGLTILLNTLCMAADGYGSPAWLEAALGVANVVFVLVFTSEAAAKLVAFTPAKYFADRWNSFDFVIVVGSLVDLSVSGALGAMADGSPLPDAAGEGGSDAAEGGSELPISPTVLRVLRLFRVARIARIAHSTAEVRLLLVTLNKALPSLSNVVALLLLLLFVCAVIGMHLFFRITDGDLLDDHTNFGTFGGSLLTLFRSATGEDWNAIMHDLMAGENCAEDAAARFHGCARWAAIPFFVAYTLISTFVMLNLLIAIVLDQFAEGRQRQRASYENPSSVGEWHIDAFRDAWAQHDPDARQRILVTSMPSLLGAIPHPLGLQGTRSYTPRADTMRMIKRLNITVYHTEARPGGVIGRARLLSRRLSQAVVSAPVVRLAALRDLDAAAAAPARAAATSDAQPGVELAHADSGSASARRRRLLPGKLIPGALRRGPRQPSAPVSADWVTYHDVLEALIADAFRAVAVTTDELEEVSPLARELSRRRQKRRQKVRHIVTGEKPKRTPRTAVLRKLGWARLEEKDAEGSALPELPTEHISRAYAAAQLQRAYRERCLRAASRASSTIAPSSSPSRRPSRVADLRHASVPRAPEAVPAARSASGAVAAAPTADDMSAAIAALSAPAAAPAAHVEPDTAEPTPAPRAACAHSNASDNNVRRAELKSAAPVDVGGGKIATDQPRLTRPEEPSAPAEAATPPRGAELHEPSAEDAAPAASGCATATSSEPAWTEGAHDYDSMWFRACSASAEREARRTARASTAALGVPPLLQSPLDESSGAAGRRRQTLPNGCFAAALSSMATAAAPAAGEQRAPQQRGSDDGSGDADGAARDFGQHRRPGCARATTVPML